MLSHATTDNPVDISNGFHVDVSLASDFVLSEAHVHLMRVPASIKLAKRSHMTTGNTDLDFKKVYFYDASFRDKPVRAAYQMEDRSGPLQTHQQLIVDATTGHVLQARSLVDLLEAPAYVFPKGYGPNANKVERVNLPNLKEISSTRPGLQGVYHRTANTCPYYICRPGGNTTVSPKRCEVEDVVCFKNATLDSIYATDLRSLFISSDKPASASLAYQVPGEIIATYIDWEKAGYPGGMINVRLEGLPVMGGIATPNASLSYEPLYRPNENINIIPDDAFPEVQVYYTAEKYFSFVKSEMTPDMCAQLGRSSICAELNTTFFNQGSNLTNGETNGPFLMVSNILTLKPDIKDFLDQLAGGKGVSAINPIVFDRSNLYPFDNAFFYGVQGSANWNCTDGECLYALGRPKTPFMGFGQGSAHDWTLDQCIAFHEMTHSVTRRFIPFLPTFTSTQHGTSSEPGAMNEAWSDYWAVVMCGSEDLASSYVGTIKRTVKNEYVSCNDTTDAWFNGQIHHDSQVFSGALWEARLAIMDKARSVSANETKWAQEWDLLVLVAQSMATTRETFMDQFKKLVTLVEGDSLISSTKSIVQAVFDKRDGQCKSRVVNILSKDGSVKGHTMYLAALGQTGTADRVSSPVQLGIFFKHSSSIVAMSERRVSWTQYVDDPFLSWLSNLGFAQLPLEYTLSWGCPAIFTYDSGKTIPKGNCRNETLEFKQANLRRRNIDNGEPVGYIDIPIPSDLPADGQVAYLTLYHQNPVLTMLVDVKSFEGAQGLNATLGLFGVMVSWGVMIAILEHFRDRRQSERTSKVKPVGP